MKKGMVALILAAAMSLGSSVLTGATDAADNAGSGNFGTPAAQTYAVRETNESRNSDRISLNSCKITYHKAIIYTGKPTVAGIRVQDANGKVLKKDQDYKIVYKNNVKLGTASFTVSGLGAYTDSVTKTYLIYLAPVEIQSVKQTGFYSNEITWKPVVGASYYKIVYKTSEMSAYKTLNKHVTATSYKHNSSTARPLKGGIEASYKVIAVAADQTLGKYSLQPGTITMKTARNGLYKESAYYHYYVNDVLQKLTWQTVDGKKYYFGSKGNAYKNGSYRINNVYYVFGSKHCLLQPANNKLYVLQGSTYYVAPDGKAISGWQIIGGKLYYFGKNGKKAVNQTIDHISLKADGSAVYSVESELKIKCKNILSSITNSSMTDSQKLRAAWNYVCGGRFYYTSIYPNLNESGWQRKLALNMLTNGGGNCYGFACTFSALAAEIGYDPVLICGRVYGSRDGASDGMTRHCWVSISGCYYDPEAQYAGWMKGVYGSGSYPTTHTVQKYQKFSE